MGTVNIISCGKIALSILIEEALCCDSRCSSRFTILFKEAIITPISNKAIKTIIKFYFFAGTGVLSVKALCKALTFRDIKKRVLIAT